MRFSIARGQFLDSLSIVARGLSSRTTLPILSGLLVSASKKGLTLTSTDLEVSIRNTSEASVEREGSAVFPGKLITDVVRSLPEAAVTVEMQGDKALLTCESSSFSLKTLSAEDFPRFPEVEPAERVNLPASLLSGVVRQVSRAVSRDETRPVLTGIYVVVEEGDLKMVATDSYRLAVREVPLEGPAERLNVVVPGKVLEEIPRMAAPEDVVQVGVSENQIVFEFGNTTFVSRRIEGSFPNYKQLIPKDMVTRVRLGREELLDAVKRVSLLAQHNTPLRLRVSVADATLSVTAMTQEVGEAREDLMAASCEGEDVEIAFNHVFLADGLAASQGEEIELAAVSPLKPGVLTSPDEQGFLYLLMPVRLG